MSAAEAATARAGSGCCGQIRHSLPIKRNLPLATRPTPTSCKRAPGSARFAPDPASKGQAGRQAQRIGSDEMPLTIVEQVRRGGAASSTDSSRGSRVFSSARTSRRARWAPMQ
jgi:hypothetical protein